jgi:hypothetical protein
MASWAYQTNIKGPPGPAGADGASDWVDITGKPATFPPTLPIASSGVTGLDAAQSAQDTAIAGKAAVVHTHVLANITDAGTAAARNIHVGTTAPSSPAVNDVWIDTN